MVKRLPAMQETWVQSLGQEGSPGEGNGNPLQYSCVENPMDGGYSPWVAKSWTQLSDLTFSLTDDIVRRRAWQPTPVLLPGESHGQMSLAGHSPWGHTESDTTVVTKQQQHIPF